MKTFRSIIIFTGLVAVLSASCEKDPDRYSNSIIGTWEWLYSTGGFAGTIYPDDGQTVRWIFSNDSILVIRENGDTTMQADFHFSGDTLLYQGKTDIKLLTEIYYDTLSLNETGIYMHSLFKRIKQ